MSFQHTDHTDQSLLHLQSLSFETFTAPSVTSNVEDDTVVVLPCTVRLPDSVKLVALTSPVTVRSSPIVTSSGSAIVTSAVSEPEPETVISFAVPDIDCTYEPVVSVPNATLLNAISCRYRCIS